MKKVISVVAGLGLVALVAMGFVALVDTPPVEVAGEGGGQMCGGIAGIECPSPNQICVDDPRDNCDPKTGGRDCSGICRGPGGGR